MLRQYIINIYISLLFSDKIKCYGTNLLVDTRMKINYRMLSQDFIYATKTDESTTKYIDVLTRADERALLIQLNNDYNRIDLI